MMPLRIATVPYLNIEPFVRALERLAPCEIIRERPSRLVDIWRRCPLDLCMLSTVDLLGARARVLDGASISARGPVRSVLVVAESPQESWRNLALDASSATSNRLALWALDAAARRLRARAYDAPLEALARGRVDASVVIGDAALEAPELAVRLDLSDIWHRRTGSPFVFAGWTSGLGSRLSTEDAEALLREARALAPELVEEVARDAARDGALATASLESYLREAISWDLSSAEKTALETFAAQVGLPAPRSASGAVRLATQAAGRVA